MTGHKLCSGGFVPPDDGPCPECGAGPDDYCRRPTRSAGQVRADLEDEVIRLRAELEKADDRWRHAVERAELFCAESDRLAKALEEKEGDMHMRIRAGYDATVADCWRKENDGLRAELLGYQEEAQIHGKNIELRDTEITRLRAELTHEKCLREQAEALCVVLRAHREEYAAQVIEGHAEIANITADNKRLRAVLAECKRDADRFKKLDALCVQSANACGRIWRIELPAATFDFLLDIDAALAGTKENDDV